MLDIILLGITRVEFWGAVRGRIVLISHIDKIFDFGVEIQRTDGRFTETACRERTRRALKSLAIGKRVQILVLSSGDGGEGPDSSNSAQTFVQ